MPKTEPILSRGWRLVELSLEAVISICLLSMATLTVVDVAGRYFFNTPFRGAYEISQMMLAITVFAALPLTTRAESHLTVSLFVDRLRGPARRFHRSVILAISAGSLAFIAWRMGVQADTLGRTGAASGTLQLPFWPLARTMSVLAWFSCAVCLVLLFRALIGSERIPPGGAGTPE